MLIVVNEIVDIFHHLGLIIMVKFIGSSYLCITFTLVRRSR